MVVCGQEFTPELLGRISNLVLEQPQLSRRALSRRVCEWLNWRAHDGRLKQMSCRVALCKLARAGALRLPDAAAAVPGARCVVSDQVLQGVTVPVNTRLANLGRVDLVLVSSRASRAAQVWKALMQRHHYLGAGALCGAQLRYLVRSQHNGIVAALSFIGSSSPSW